LSARWYCPRRGRVPNVLKSFPRHSTSMGL
jgi:hypothetical protein